MDELPSRRFSKPVRGRVVLKSDAAATGERVDYIETVRGRDGATVYVLNVWRRPGIPAVVRDSEVESVEPFGRPTC